MMSVFKLPYYFSFFFYYAFSKTFKCPAAAINLNSGICSAF